MAPSTILLATATGGRVRPTVVLTRTTCASAVAACTQVQATAAATTDLQCAVSLSRYTHKEL